MITAEQMRVMRQMLESLRADGAHTTEALNAQLQNNGTTTDTQETLNANWSHREQELIGRAEQAEHALRALSEQVTQLEGFAIRVTDAELKEKALVEMEGERHRLLGEAAVKEDALRQRAERAEHELSTLADKLNREQLQSGPLENAVQTLSTKNVQLTQELAAARQAAHEAEAAAIVQLDRAAVDHNQALLHQQQLAVRDVTAAKGHLERAAAEQYAILQQQSIRQMQATHDQHATQSPVRQLELWRQQAEEKQQEKQASKDLRAAVDKQASLSQSAADKQQAARDKLQQAAQDEQAARDKQAALDKQAEWDRQAARDRQITLDKQAARDKQAALVKQAAVEEQQAARDKLQAALDKQAAQEKKARDDWEQHAAHESKVTREKKAALAKQQAARDKLQAALDKQSAQEKLSPRVASSPIEMWRIKDQKALRDRQHTTLEDKQSPVHSDTVAPTLSLSQLDSPRYSKRPTGQKQDDALQAMQFIARLAGQSSVGSSDSESNAEHSTTTPNSPSRGSVLSDNVRLWKIKH